MDAAMSVSFVVLLVGAMARFLIRHPGAADTPWVVALTSAVALAYVVRPGTDGDGPAGRWTKVWLGCFTCAWVVLVVMAPSFAWSAVPIVYTALRLLSERAALVLIGLLTVIVVAAQVRISGADPLLILGPPAVAGLASAVFLHMQRQSARQRRLIDDLIRTRAGLAASERRAGTLAERERLSMEIHDTLAQGLSSQRMLLQAADRVWDADPDAARRHVGTASGIAERNLAEARRFVHDLAPADLADGGGLPAALQSLADRESANADGLVVRFRTDGRPTPLPAAVEAALLRIAQGAAANIREHARATEATLTLSFLGDEVVLDVADNGRGFTPQARGGTRVGSEAGGPASAAGEDAPRSPGQPRPAGPSDRGHGIPAMQARIRQLGGTLTVESAAGDGTVVSAAVPLPGADTRRPGTG
ncbi:sensor histidine kinase [Yinghuangia sp. KLBMP8922]|uniref:Oxygen sensor histidine kinase NreB n=2 Tax=Yinghuangia soli TaxID=2908204 RepID=A0AA41Q819_9ACTN|nr:sensor histidine kinase [Yinghuangia soli]MCF2532089.1 sensor histidine kinase [Yinghuangia soli]